MLKYKLKYLVVFLVCTVQIFASSEKVKKNENGFSFWTLKSISGLLALEGNYRSGTYRLTEAFTDERTTSLFSGRLDLYTSSVFLHPNFFQLDANFSYSPAKNLDKYIVSPDNSEINTNERIDLNGILFSERIFSLNPYFNFNHTFNRREFTTNIESFYTNYGTRLFSPNSILPFNINVLKSKWDETEFQTNRKFKTNQFAVNTEFNRPISDFNNNRLNIDYYDYLRNYSVNSTIHNKSVNWNLSNSFNLNQSTNTNLNSIISIINQFGSQQLNRFMVNENVFTDLIYGFSFSGRYLFYKIKQNLFDSKQSDIEARLDHQLFQSLRSHITFNSINASQTFYKEKITRGEIGFDYTKTIPTGFIRLNFNHALSKENRENFSGLISVVDESVLLADGLVSLLKIPFVAKNSIVVKNSAGLIIFQENFDFLLIERGSYTEIQRIPGGQITNGETVLVSYNAEQQPSVSFNTSINRYGASVTLFNNFIEVYFNAADQNYSNISVDNTGYLRTLNQKIYGIKFSYEYLDAGAEYEDYKSNITPYTSSRFYLRLHRQTSDNLLTTINGGYRIYNLIEDNSTQKFADASVILTYLLGQNSRIVLEDNYVFQEGRQLDLDLNSLRIGFVTTFRQIEISFGYENYNRRLLEEKTKFSGAFAKIIRRF
jgi:hypothetical protein